MEAGRAGSSNMSFNYGIAHVDYRVSVLVTPLSSEISQLLD